MFLKHYLKLLFCDLQKIKLKSKKIRFLFGSYFENTIFEGYNSIGKNTQLLGCEIGMGSYTGKNVDFTKVKIGRYCSIASSVKNVVGRHPTTTFVSTHPAFFSMGKAAGFTFSSGQFFKEVYKLENGYLVEIGNDVWIGENVLITDGVTIGNGAVVGANSLVNKNLDPYSINVGTPSRCVGYRFNSDDIRFLEYYQWWAKDYNWIKENYHIFHNIEEFKKQVGAL